MLKLGMRGLRMGIWLILLGYDEVEVARTDKVYVRWVLRLREFCCRSTVF